MFWVGSSGSSPHLPPRLCQGLVSIETLPAVVCYMPSSWESYVAVARNNRSSSALSLSAVLLAPLASQTRGSSVEAQARSSSVEAPGARVCPTCACHAVASPKYLVRLHRANQASAELHRIPDVALSFTQAQVH